MSVVYHLVEAAVARLLVRSLPKAAPPAQEEPAGSFLIGHRSDNGEPVMASEDELKRHFLLLGSTGTGKTTAIRRLFDMEVARWQS